MRTIKDVIKVYPLPWTLNLEPRSEAEIVDHAMESMAFSEQLDRAVLDDPDLTDEEKKRYVADDELDEEENKAQWIALTDTHVAVVRDANGKRILGRIDDDLTSLLVTLCVVGNWSPEEDEDGNDPVADNAEMLMANIPRVLRMEQMGCVQFLRRKLVFEPIKDGAARLIKRLKERKQQ